MPTRRPVRRTRKNAVDNRPVDEDAAYELSVFIENDADLYRQQYIPIVKNLVAKKAKGTYTKEGAVKLWMYLMDNGAKKYARESGMTEWNRTFGVATRKKVARDFNEDFLTEYSYGNWDEYIPKKYQPKPKRAAKRSAARRRR